MNFNAIGGKMSRIVCALAASLLLSACDRAGGASGGLAQVASGLSPDRIAAERHVREVFRSVDCNGAVFTRLSLSLPPEIATYYPTATVEQLIAARVINDLWTETKDELKIVLVPDELTDAQRMNGIEYQATLQLIPAGPVRQAQLAGGGKERLEKPIVFEGLEHLSFERGGPRTAADARPLDALPAPEVAVSSWQDPMPLIAANVAKVKGAWQITQRGKPVGRNDRVNLGASETALPMDCGYVVELFASAG